MSVEDGGCFLLLRCKGVWHQGDLSGGSSEGDLRVFRRQRKIGKPIRFHARLLGIAAHVAIVRIDGCRALDRRDGDNLPIELDLCLAGFGIAALPLSALARVESSDGRFNSSRVSKLAIRKQNCLPMIAR